MTIATLSFAQPGWLLAGLGAAVLVLLLSVRVGIKRRAALRQFGARGGDLVTSVSRPRRVLKHGLVVLGVLLGFCALARPQRGVRQEEAHQRGIDLLFAIDTSRSMLAPDLKPSRLTRAKLAVRDLVGKFGGDRVGLVAFAGDAFLQCPLTLDRDIFEQTLEAVDVGLIPRGGTDVGRAIEVAQGALHNEPGNQKILVLLTDGEDLEAHAVDAARAAGQAGIRIYTVGVGTPGGELIPIADQAPGHFVQDESGAFVHSRLDEPGLKAIATAGGGTYRLLGADGRGLEELYQQVLAKLPKEALGAKLREVPIERFQWPLGLAVLCLAIEPLVREHKRRRALVEPPIATLVKPIMFRRALAAALLVLFGLGGAGVAQASPQTAERAYHEGKFQQAATDYQRAAAADPKNGLLQYNTGVAAYKTGDYAQAQAGFESALHGGRPELQAEAFYNRGNTLFRLGQATGDKQPEQTIEQWKQAIVAYESALKLSPKDADAAYNRELVKRKLAELTQKQDDQKKQQDQQAKNQQDKNQNGQKDKQSQNQNGQKDKSQNGQPNQQDKSQNGQKDKQAQNQNGQNDKSQNGQPNQQDKSQSGQKDKQAQNQNGQNDKSQSGQKDQQAQHQSGQNDPSQNGQKDKQEAQHQSGQGQPTPAGQRGAGTARADAEAGDQKGEAQVPGQLSRADAKSLLDALRGDERLMPLSPTGRPQAVSADDVVRKDW